MLKGAELAFDFLVAGEDPTTSTSYWVKGDKFLPCATRSTDRTTVTSPRCR